MTIEFQPYVGPRPFERKDQALFFGRDREAYDLLSLVVSHEAVLLYAQSGAGKTSLINAGLVPLLEKEGFGVLPLARVSGPIPDTMKPEEIPNLYVFNALMSWAEDKADPKRLAQMSLVDFLKEREHPIDEMGLPSPRIIIFDQVEELFAFYPERWIDREGFFEKIYSALEDDFLLRVVFVIREEYLAQLDTYASFLPEKLRTRFRLERLRERAALLAVKGPLANTGRTFAPGVAESLVKDLLKDRAVSATGEMVEIEGQYVEPVQLQVVCLKLWSGLPPETTDITHDHLQKFGDVDLALSDFYEDAIQVATQGTGVEEVSLRDWFGKTLITPAKTRGTVYRGENSTGGIPNAAVDVLESRHLIRAEYRAGAHWYELTHDRLIESILASNEKWYAKRWEDHKNPLTELAREWQRLGKDEGSLLRGARLGEATKWAEAHPTDLDELERVFLEASLNHRQRALEAQARAAKIFRRLSATLAVALLIVGLASFVVFRRAEVVGQARATAVAAAAEVAAQRDIAISRQLVVYALTRLDDQLDLALLLSLEANRIADTVESRSSLLASLESSPHLTTFLHGHTDQVRSVTFSPDGKTLASGSADQAIILWDVATGQPIGQPLTAHTAEVQSVAFSPDGQTLASGSADNTIILWDVVTGQPIGQPLTGHSDSVFSVAFSPDGKTLASGSKDKTIILWDVSTGQPIGEPFTRHTAEVRNVAFSPDGQTLASGSADNTIILWDVVTGQPIGQPLIGHSNSVFSVAFSPDGKTLASGSKDKTIILWDIATGQPIGQPLTGHSDSVFSVAFSPGGYALASASGDRTITLWNVAIAQPIGQPLTGHSDWVNSVAFSPDGKTLASGSADDAIILWDVTTRHLLGQSLTGHTDQVRSVTFSPDGQTLASGSADNTIIIWDVVTGQPIGQPLTGHSDSVFSVAFSPDGKTLASGSKDKTIILWDVVTGQPIGQPLIRHSNSVFSVAFSPDGKTLASGSADQTIILWDVAAGRPIGEPLTSHTAEVRSVAFSPDGKTLALGSEDGTIILWDVATHQLLNLTFIGHTDAVLSVAFSPDGQTLASASYRIIFLWDAITGRRFDQTLTGHTDWVRSVAFSPDGQTLASGSADKTIILWDVTSGQPIGQPLTGYSDSVFSVAFNPEGKTLASGSADRTVILWDVSLESWQTRACRIANRNLTQAEWNQFIGPDIPYEHICSTPYLVPTLLSPDEGTSFSKGQDVKLVWEWERNLAENEFFEVRIRPKGEQEFDHMGLTKVPYQFIPASKLTQTGMYEWQVVIVSPSREEKVTSRIWSFEVR